MVNTSEQPRDVAESTSVQPKPKPRVIFDGVTPDMLDGILSFRFRGSAARDTHVVLVDDVLLRIGQPLAMVNRILTSFGVPPVDRGGVMYLNDAKWAAIISHEVAANKCTMTPIIVGQSTGMQ